MIGVPIRVNLLCNKQTGTNPQWRKGFEGVRWEGRSKAREFINKMDKEDTNGSEHRKNIKPRYHVT